MQGFVNVYKKSGVSSGYVVNAIKRKFHIKKVGHMGTLDPMAQGVLPIAIGKATRMFDYFLSKRKTYVVKMQFGYTTDTLDSMGQVTEKSDYIPIKQEVLNILPQFIGQISQLPPQYSAKNIAGTRAYKLARLGQKVDLTPCNVTIHNIKLLDFSGDVCVLEVECGSGTYIRSLVRDIANSCNSVATMIYLERTKSGYFVSENAVDIDDIQDIVDVITPITQVFDYMPKLNLTEIQYKKIINGLHIKHQVSDGVYFAEHNQALLGVVEVKDNLVTLKTFLQEDNI